MVVVTIVCIIPLSLQRSIDSLSQVSTMSIIFYFCLVFKVFGRFDLISIRSSQFEMMIIHIFVLVLDCFRFRRENHIELLARRYSLVATIWCAAMLTNFLYVVVMSNTNIRSLRIITESITGKNESNCEGGHEHLHRSVHFGGCLWLRGIQCTTFFRKYFAQFFAIVGQWNHQIGFRVVGGVQFSVGHISMQSESVFVDLSSGKRRVLGRISFEEKNSYFFLLFFAVTFRGVPLHSRASFSIHYHFNCAVGAHYRHYDSIHRIGDWSRRIYHCMYCMHHVSDIVFHQNK